MHTPTRRKPSRFSQAVASLAALLCLWMATGGVVGHTDDLRADVSASPRAVWSHAPAADAPADACAACQWLAGVQPSPLAVSVLSLPTGSGCWSYPVLTTCCSWRLLTQNGTRAPPLSPMLVALSASS